MKAVKEEIEETVEEVIEETVEEVIEKPYEMRKLKNSDVWTITRILAKILPDELKNAFIQVASGEKTLKQVGGMVVCDMAVMVTKNVYKAQNEVDSFCADLIGKTVDELNDMEFGTSVMIFIDVFGDVKNASFFKALSKLL